MSSFEFYFGKNGSVKVGFRHQPGEMSQWSAVKWLRIGLAADNTAGVAERSFLKRVER
ncbi:hypothetical protein AT05_03300 [Schleiferia thermophila str. Yellowstone]|nr:hypothetical protein AT05_03300 [Schleiferia thermophila str. Yellowstone]